MKTLRYETRDGTGKDIIRDIPIKEFKKQKCDCCCDICGQDISEGTAIKDAVSSNFTDWQIFQNGFICEKCSELFSVYPYSYVYSPSVGIELMNVRQIRDRITNLDGVTPPFMICISATQKKHLFYRSKFNNSKAIFAVNLETETIYTSCERQKILFDIVENLLALKCTKEMLKLGKLSNVIPISKAPIIFDFLWDELNRSREIQIPLFCGQKKEISEEEALCNLDSILMTW